ncbi:hypothetical protein TNCV_458781 [Trichonephila clavipes]|nr:hypothetical protein TNCV_458781 [Trichonephila clavipes]
MAVSRIWYGWNRDDNMEYHAGFKRLPITSSPEDRFYLHHQDGHIHVWWHCGECPLAACIHTGPSSAMKVWGAIGDEAHFWLNGYVNKQNFRIWSEANPQVYVETPLHPEKLTVWCALWAGGILLQKR